MSITTHEEIIEEAIWDTLEFLYDRSSMAHAYLPSAAPKYYSLMVQKHWMNEQAYVAYQAAWDTMAYSLDSALR